MNLFKKKNKNKVPDINQIRIDEIVNKYKVGEFIEYLGVKMIIIGCNEYHLSIYAPSICIPGLKVEWMDKQYRLQSSFLIWWKLEFCNKV